MRPSESQCWEFDVELQDGAAPANIPTRVKKRIPVNERAGLRADAAAEYLGISTAGFYRLNKDEPEFPSGVRLTPGVVVWRRSELDDWLRRRRG
jgi:predicted DNA-binding transcriptional regulator AlpA